MENFREIPFLIRPLYRKIMELARKSSYAGYVIALNRPERSAMATGAASSDYVNTTLTKM